MAIEKPAKARSKISDSGSRIAITIPSRKNILASLFISVWICFWFFGWINAITRFPGDGGSAFEVVFMSIWIVAWTIGGIFAISLLLWGVIGKVLVAIDLMTLKIARKIGPVTFHRDYALTSCSNFRVNPVSRMVSRGQEIFEFFGKSDGTIAFDYGLKTVKFGLSIDEAEAGYIIKLLQDRGFIKRQ